MKIFFLLCLLTALFGCSKPDYSKPHEYIKVIGYGEGWVSTESNKRRFDHLLKAQIHTELGSGECEKHLKTLDPEKVFVEMAATNYLIRTESDSAQDIPIKYAKLQCVAYHGQDQNCEEKRKKLLDDQIHKLEKSDASIYEGAALLIKSSGDCDIRNEIGQVRTFSLDDSKSFRYIPK